MATKLQKAVRFTLLWMLVPAGMAAIGYFVLGPQLGSHEAPAKEPPQQTTDEEEDDRPTEPRSVRFSPPAVEVSVKKGQTIRDRDMVIRRSSPRPKPKPQPEKPPATQPSLPVISPPSDGAETIPIGDGRP